MSDHAEEDEEEEEELDVTIEGVEEDEEEEESSETWDTWDGELSLSRINVQTSDELRAAGPESLHLPANSPQVREHIRQQLSILMKPT